MGFDSFDIVRLSLLPGIGPSRGRALLNRFDSMEEIRRASGRELSGIRGIDRTLARKIRMTLGNKALLKDIDRQVDRSERLCRSDGYRLLTYRDAEFPASLGHIYDPPLFLFTRGTLHPADEEGIAIVGTRNATAYGKQAAERFATELAELGISIISGLALGIDTVAHRAALGRSGRTVAVLGSGVDVIYPAQNRKLAETISVSGALVSELPLGAKPDAVNFPRRNRIISGLSRGVLVVETAEKGGAVITAHFALDQGKSLFAIPGRIFDTASTGTHILIQSGTAKLVRSVDDILEDLPGLSPKSQRNPPLQLSLFEEEIMERLGADPLHIDHLSEQTGMSTSDLLVHLLQLEFKGAVRQLPGKMFISIRDG